MNRRIFSIFLISIVGLFLFSIHDKTEAENWKLFFKDEEGIWSYDKDSIHYPYNTKGFLGSIKTDKNIVRVWTKLVKDDFNVLFLEQLLNQDRFLFRSQIHQKFVMGL